MNTIDLVIPTINGVALLKKHLPYVLKNSRLVRQFIIVDDGSTDETIGYLQKLSPKIKIIKNETSLGFTMAVNQGFAASNADLVVLLNNDVHPEPKYIENSLNHFKDPTVFAVTFNEKSSNFPLASWKNGKYQYQRSKDKTRPALSAWASGGSAVFNRKIWTLLGGFNPIYSPGYWEDIDIGWRAYKAGFKIIWEPKSKVDHQHESTFSKLSIDFVNLIKQRNELLFIWQNFSDPLLLLDHLLFLIFYTLTHPGYLKIIFASLGQVSHLRRLSESILSDREVLNLLQKPYEFN